MSPWNTGEAAQHNLQFEVAVGETVIEVYRVGNDLVKERIDGFSCLFTHVPLLIIFPFLSSIAWI